MELLGYIAALPLAAEAASEEGGGSFLVSPGLGLMIWTLVLFLFTMWVLSKLAFPKIQEALDKRAKTIAESIDAAERQRKESDELLAEYRGRLAEAREQADDIMARARKAGRDGRGRGDRRRQGETRGAGRRRRSATSKPRRGARWSRSATRSPI